MALLLNNHEPDILCLNETWLNDRKIPLHEDYEALYSPASEYQGVAIYHKKSITLTPFHQEEWSKHFIFAKHDTTIIIALYIQPAEKMALTDKLMWIMGSF